VTRRTKPHWRRIPRISTSWSSAPAFAGVSCAAELAHSGKSVAVLDMYDQLLYGAALFAESYFSGEEFAALTSASRAFFEAPPPGFAETPILSPRGALYVAGLRDIKAMGALSFKVRATDARIELLDRAEALSLVPILRPDYPVLSLFEPNSRDIDVDVFYQGYSRRATSAGAMMVPGAELNAALWNGRRWSIETAGGHFSAEIIVNAAGAWADIVYGRCREGTDAAPPLGLRPMRRSVCYVRPEGSASDAIAEDMPFVITAGEDGYFRYGRGRFLISPADESPTVPREQPKAEDIALGIKRFNEMTTATLRRNLDRARAGIRTFARIASR
jgi:D-arginine dehydrogenase